MKSRKKVKTILSLVTLGLLLLVVVPVALAWPFSDVPVGYWAYDQIHRMANLNITSGCGGGKYCPLNPVNRDQMAVFMDNLTKAWTNENEPYLYSLDHKYWGPNPPAFIARSNDGTGVNGYSYGGGWADNGVYGETNSTDPSEAGVFGRSTSKAAGVYGYNNDSDVNTTTSYGVRAYSLNGTALYASTGSSSDVAVVGYVSGGPALGGWWTPGGEFSGTNGVLAHSNTYNAVAVLGDQDHASGWSGYFYSAGHGVGISTPSGKTGLVVYGGTKSAAADTDQGARLLYTEESTQVWFTDYGFGQLQDGRAAIAIDPLFAQTVNLNEPYHVFVQVYGAAEVYVANRTATGFEVLLLSGDSNVEFSYRIVAKRLGYEADRLAPAPWAGGPMPGAAAEGEPVNDWTPPPVDPQPEEGK